MPTIGFAKSPGNTGAFCRKGAYFEKLCLPDVAALRPY